MYRIGLLLLTGPLRIVAESISNYIRSCNKKIFECLYVKIESDISNPCSKSDSSNLKRLSEFVPLVYNKASSLCQNLDVRFILSNSQRNTTDISSKYDIVLTNSMENDCNIKNYVFNNLKVTCDTIIKLNEKESTCNEDFLVNSTTSDFQAYKTVCLGGTFDRLHNGHKVLLSEAALRATDKLIVGVTDGGMLKKKTLWELIEPVEKRISDVTEFLYDVDPSLHYEVVSIIDPYGPTITDSDIDCIVVSAETKVGGERVNCERKARGMSELSMYVVDLVENLEAIPCEEKKLSSSNSRMRLLGTCLKQPKNFSNGPFTVFLQGLPITGKSCITYYFEKEGWSIINCSDIIKSILTKEEERKEFSLGFSKNILKDSFIDYGKLILICLLDKEKRKWTANYLSKKVEEEIKQKIKIQQNQGIKFHLVQDSTLLHLQFNDQINEIWSTILPVAEVETRMSKYFDLSTEDAKKVILSMPSNSDYVAKSHRVFCSLWSSENTKQQVLKAWADIGTNI